MDPNTQHQQVAVVPAARESGSAHGYPAFAYPIVGDLASDADAGGLIEYWRMLRRRLGTLLLITFLGLLGAFLVTLPQTPVYRARTAIEIQNVNSDFMNVKQISPVSEEAAVNVLTDVQTQMRIIQSESLVDRVIDKFKADGKLKTLQGTPGHLSSVLTFLGIASPDAAEQDYKARQKAMKSLAINQMGQTRVIEVIYTSSDPRFAADFVNTLTSEYIKSNIEARWKMSEQTGAWLSHELEPMRAKLRGSEGALQEYARRSGLLYTTPSSGNSEKTNVSEDKLRQLQEALSKAQADKAAAQSQYETAKSALPETLGDVLNDDSLRDLQARLTDLSRQRAELITTFTPKNEKVQRVEAQMEPLQTAFDHQRDSIISRIRNDYDTAVWREKLLHADYSAQAAVVTDQADKSIQYNILKREVDSNRQLYESMLQQVKAASVASAIRASNVRIVDSAKTPYKPYSPNYSLNCAFGLIAGLLGGITFIVIRERADGTLQEPGDIRFWTKLPELGIIPSVSLGSSRRQSKSKVMALSAPAPLPATNSKGSIELISLQHEPNVIAEAFAEAFRTILASIMFANEDGTRPRVLVVTSANLMEGKTTVVSNLGIALAEIQKNVLIIDADLRQPRMHLLFDLPNERGLSDLLRQPSSADSALDSLIQKTSISGLNVLPSGPPSYAAANLLYSPNLQTLLVHFKKKYDVVLIDTPPSLEMTDARILGKLADAVILVARVRETTREAVIAVNQRFNDDRTRVLGAILNDWNPKKSRNGYYGSHSGSYYGRHHRSAAERDYNTSVPPTLGL